jgi:hypothetical protein
VPQTKGQGRIEPPQRTLFDEAPAPLPTSEVWWDEEKEPSRRGRARRRPDWAVSPTDDREQLDDN